VLLAQGIDFDAGEVLESLRLSLSRSASWAGYSRPVPIPQRATCLIKVAQALLDVPGADMRSRAGLWLLRADRRLRAACALRQRIARACNAAANSRPLRLSPSLDNDRIGIVVAFPCRRILRFSTRWAQ